MFKVSERRGTEQSHDINSRPMGKRTDQSDDGTGRLALHLIDLRAHFEAQLRTVARAEQCLFKCRSAQDAVAFDAAAGTLRAETQTVADNRRTVGDLVEQTIVEARGLTFSG